jgi:hypothetical protein
LTAITVFTTILLPAEKWTSCILGVPIRNIDFCFYHSQAEAQDSQKSYLPGGISHNIQQCAYCLAEIIIIESLLPILLLCIFYVGC